jgi:hypothetical protein
MNRFDILQGHFLFWVYWNEAGLTKRDKARVGRLPACLVVTELPDKLRGKVISIEGVRHGELHRALVVTPKAQSIYENLVKLYYPLKN